LNVLVLQVLELWVLVPVDSDLFKMREVGTHVTGTVKCVRMEPLFS